MAIIIGIPYIWSDRSNIDGCTYRTQEGVQQDSTELCCLLVSAATLPIIDRSLELCRNGALRRDTAALLSSSGCNDTHAALSCCCSICS
jgi:hypothetical protein